MAKVHTLFEQKFGASQNFALNKPVKMTNGHEHIMQMMPHKPCAAYTAARPSELPPTEMSHSYAAATVWNIYFPQFPSLITWLIPRRRQKAFLVEATVCICAPAQPFLNVLALNP